MVRCASLSPVQLGRSTSGLDLSVPTSERPWLRSRPRQHEPNPSRIVNPSIRQSAQTGDRGHGPHKKADFLRPHHPGVPFAVWLVLPLPPPLLLMSLEGRSSQYHRPGQLTFWFQLQQPRRPARAPTLDVAVRDGVRIRPSCRTSLVTYAGLT
jgi:hypothetical protein